MYVADVDVLEETRPFRILGGLGQLDWPKTVDTESA